MLPTIIGFDKYWYNSKSFDAKFKIVGVKALTYLRKESVCYTHNE